MKIFRIRMATYAYVAAETKEDTLEMDISNEINENLELVSIEEVE